MTVTHKLTIHMDDRRCVPCVDVVQLDANTRVLELTLLCGGVAWTVPSGKKISVAFRKADGHRGWYDELPDGAAACSAHANVVTVVLAPQVLTCAGKTEVAVVIQDGTTLDQIAVFPVTVMVARNPAAGKGLSNDYFRYKTLGEVNAAVVSAIDKAKNVGHYVTYKEVALAVDTVANTITISEGYIFTRTGRWQVQAQTVARNTQSNMSLLVYDTAESDIAKRTKSIFCDDMTDKQVLIAVLTGGGYEKSENANYIPGRWSVDGVVYPEVVGMADVKSRVGAVERQAAEAVARAKNVAHYISVCDTVLDIVADQITLNRGYLFAPDGRIDITENVTVARNTESSVSLLVYDRGDKAVRSVSAWAPLDVDQILIAVIAKLYPGSENANYIPGRWSVDGVVYPEVVGMADVKDRLEALESRPSSGFGLRWYALGDSITRGMYGYDGGAGVDTVNCWAALAAKHNGWDLTNKGVSGSGYVAKGGAEPQTDAREQVDAIDFSGVELVTLAYGVNDWLRDNGVGSMEDDVEVGGTFISNMRYCIEKILGDDPAVKIVVISPINCRSGCTADTNWGIGKANGAGTTLEDVFRAEKTVCEHYGIEFIDMLHSSVVNRLNIEAALPDTVHPSKAIHAQLAKELSRRIMSSGGR